jgi:hypothetical protein
MGGQQFMNLSDLDGGQASENIGEVFLGVQMFLVPTENSIQRFSTRCNTVTF